MANLAKNAILRAKIEGVLTDIMVKTTASQVYVNDTTTLAAHLATLAASADVQALQQAVDALGELSKKDKVSYADLETALASLIDGKAEASALTDEIARAKAAEEAAAAAAAAADEKAVKAQSDVDDLKTYVGTIPEGATATDVIGYVQEKTAGIATEGAMTELGNRVTAIETNMGEKPEGEDATVWGKFGTQAEAIADNAEAVEDHASRIEAIEGDYLKAADKTELQGNIDTVAGAVERLTNGVSAEEIDGVNDLIQYVKDHGTEVTGMKEDISDNADAIAGVAGRMDTAEGKISALETASALHAEKTYVDEQVQALQGVDSGLDTRLKAVEAAVGESGSVADDIEAAKQAAISAAAVDATSKANAAEAAAKEHATGLNTAMNARVEALEAIDHEHANKSELDLIASGDKAKWDAAEAKAHEHANKAELDLIASGDKAKWDAAEGNAKAHADSLNTAMDVRMQSVEALKHTHENKTVIDGITAANVASWNGKAKVYGADETVDLAEGEIFIQLI